MGVLPKLFKLWPWVYLDLFYAKVKFGHIGLCMGKSENYLFFGTYCSFRSQSCLKHSAKWVYEVEWVSKVKVILWSWSKVTQISKLNVWLFACILRWAIQGLRALLFQMSWHFVRMLIIIISRSSLKLGLVGSKTRLLGQQATQVSNLGPLWPSCFSFFLGYYVQTSCHLDFFSWIILCLSHFCHAYICSCMGRKFVIKILVSCTIPHVHICFYRFSWIILKLYSLVFLGL